MTNQTEKINQALELLGKKVPSLLSALYYTNIVQTEDPDVKAVKLKPTENCVNMLLSDRWVENSRLDELALLLGAELLRIIHGHCFERRLSGINALIASDYTCELRKLAVILREDDCPDDSPIFSLYLKCSYRSFFDFLFSQDPECLFTKRDFYMENVYSILCKFFKDSEDSEGISKENPLLDPKAAEFWGANSGVNYAKDLEDIKEEVAAEGLAGCSVESSMSSSEVIDLQIGAEKINLNFDKKLIRRGNRRDSRSVSSRMKLNRRFPYVFPGKKILKKEKVLITLDVSWSMPVSIMRKVNSLISSTASYDVWISFWSEEMTDPVQRCSLENREAHVRRGGTKLNCIPQKLEKLPKFDTVIVLTDGELFESRFSKPRVDSPRLQSTRFIAVVDPHSRYKKIPSGGDHGELTRKLLETGFAEVVYI